MSIFDIAYGSHCDHMVREPISFSGSDVLLRWVIDSVLRRVNLYRNGELVTDTLTLSFNAVRPKWIQITGMVINSTLYPPDDYELEYAVVAESCSKCSGGE